MTLAEDLLGVLDDPTHMWSHALKELSNDGQRLFLTLTLLPEPISSDVLQIAYTSQRITRSESFLDSLRSLEDSFINIEKRHADLRAVSFRNPSLEDFAKTYLDSNTDWLDILLSSPKYYEQVQILFELARAETEIRVDPRSKLRKEAPAKYPGIRTWVGHSSSKFIGMAINLIDEERAEIYVDTRRSRFGQLLRIISTYGLPTDEIMVDKLRLAAKAALNPSTQVSADATVELLRYGRYRAILDRVIQDNAAALMRVNILDKDGWKFAILSKLDKLLELDLEQTWQSWGDTYVEYAKSLAQSLAESVDDEELRIAIKEMTDISGMLAADLYEEIDMLEKIRADLPEEDDYDDTSSNRVAQSNAVDESARLDIIFSSLL